MSSERCFVPFDVNASSTLFDELSIFENLKLIVGPGHCVVNPPIVISFLMRNFEHSFADSEMNLVEERANAKTSLEATCLIKSVANKCLTVIL